MASKGLLCMVVVACSTGGEPAGPSGEGAGARIARLVSARPQPIKTSAQVELRGGRARIVDVDSGLGAEIGLRGARPKDGESDGDLVVFRGAEQGGADVAVRLRTDGLEDYVVFAAPPVVSELVYDVALDGAAGLRLVEGTLELLDDGGAPRLRVAPPEVTDALGARHPATLDVEGCAVDRDPRAPWGRTPTPPGASTCGLRVSWGPVAYPAVVDPLWTTTGDMVQNRRLQTATLIDAGGPKVLVAGGDGGPGVYTLAGAELYDPATNSWAATGSMVRKRASHVAALLVDGRVLVAGGSGSDSRSAELYDPATGSWRFTREPSGRTTRMHDERVLATATVLSGGRILVAGGAVTTFSYPPPGPNTSAEIFDPATESWSYTMTAAGVQTRMSNGRRRHTATLLGDGTVLVTGGDADGSYASYLASADLYDPATGVWTPAPPLNGARAGHTAARLADGSAIIVGGEPGKQFSSLGADVYDPVARAWHLTSGPPLGARADLAGALVGGTGMLVVAGGGGGFFSSDTVGYANTNTAEAYLPSLDAWLPIDSMAAVRASFTLTPIPGGRLLAVGGMFPGPAAEVLSLVCSSDADCGAGFTCAGTTPRICRLALGQVCKRDDQCASDTCAQAAADKRCAAVASCPACQVIADDGSGCVPVASGRDVKLDCAGNAASCGGTTCDGAGSCQAVAPAGTVCSRSCSDATRSLGVCDGTSTGCPAAVDSPCPGFETCGDDGIHCGTSCEWDPWRPGWAYAPCVDGAYCTWYGACRPSSLPDGAPCTAPGDCLGGSCVRTIDGTYRCTALASCPACELVDATGGSCVPAAAGTDPNRDCAANAATCGGITCDGAGSCAAVAPAGTVCATSCSGELEADAVCDGLATGCPAPEAAAPCTDGRVCEGTACAATCAWHELPSGSWGYGACVAGMYCDSFSCQPLVPTGSPCGFDNNCASGHCLPGPAGTKICAAVASCQVCQTVDATGTRCENVPAGTDPLGQCYGDIGYCTQETCNGFGSCRVPVGTPCDSTSCSGGVQTLNSCDPAGRCVASSATCPAGASCTTDRSGRCASACDASGGCGTGYRCDPSGGCVPGLDGDPCTRGDECASGDCADHVCCDRPCNGPCEACSASGTCETVSGSPVGGRNCGYGVCGGSCDGLRGDSCDYPESGTSCGDPYCVLTNVHRGPVCDGVGGCGAIAGETVCPFGCSGGVCLADGDAGVPDAGVADAGTADPPDAGDSPDAGDDAGDSPDAGDDAGDDAGPMDAPTADAGEIDAATGSPAADCGCRVGARSHDAPVWSVALLVGLALALASRRRRRR